MHVKVFFTTIEGELTALFPFEAATLAPSECVSYAHIGQHSAASTSWLRDARNLRPLNDDDVKQLTAELMRIGYDVEILPRPMPSEMKRAAHAERQRQIKAYNAK